MANIPQFTKQQDSDLYNDELSQALINSIGQNGFAISPLNTENINNNLNSSQSGTIFFNTDTQEWWANQNGTLVKLNVSSIS